LLYNIISKLAAMWVVNAWMRLTVIIMVCYCIV